MLPLLDEHNTAVFDKEGKAEILKNTFFAGAHLKDIPFDETFKEEVERDVERMKNGSVSSNNDWGRDMEFLNGNISLEEIQAVLQMQRVGIAHGPHAIYSDLLLHTGKQLQSAIHLIYSKSWQEGVIPEDWKQAEVKFLKKSGKASYHSASAYRPISLTSCLGKGLERIITQRLYAFCEHNKIIDRDQEGFRHFRGCTHAILRLVQDVCNGFNDGESTVAVLIDMEKAYDSVWREGLLCKLFNRGIVGRVWQWIFAFLQDRNVACILQEYKSHVFATNIGLPQGSVIAPLLFHLFIADNYKEIGCERVNWL